MKEKKLEWQLQSFLSIINLHEVKRKLVNGNKLI